MIIIRIYYKMNNVLKVKLKIFIKKIKLNYLQKAKFRRKNKLKDYNKR